MTEIIFMLMVAFVAYVAYSVLTDKNSARGDTHTLEERPVPANPFAAIPAQPVVEPVVPVIEKTSVTLSDELKNPATGEVCKIPNNYRFGKRWIKEALVTEGLLDKIYKNNELDEVASAKIQVAMDALRSMDKYKV